MKRHEVVSEMDFHRRFDLRKWISRKKSGKKFVEVSPNGLPSELQRNGFSVERTQMQVFGENNRIDVLKHKQKSLWKVIVSKEALYCLIGLIILSLLILWWILFRGFM